MYVILDVSCECTYGGGDLLWPVDVVLEVHLIGQVHEGRARLKHHALLTTVGVRELDLTVQATYTPHTVPHSQTRQERGHRGWDQA